MTSKWNCDICGREIISEKENGLCLECWWRELVEKIEITSVTIRDFMEKCWFTYFEFDKDKFESVIKIGIQRKKVLTFFPQVEKLSINYYPKTQTNRCWEGEYSEYSAFLEKLFQFAEKEKIKRIRGNCKIEIKSDFEKSFFKVNDIIIEKKN